MADHLQSLSVAVDTARAGWGARAVESLTPAELLRLNEQLATAQRLLDAARSRVACEIARQSRPELGADSLAKQQGFRDATALIASTAGSTGGDAKRLVKVGDATTPRATFAGEPAPARHPFVADALAKGLIGAQASNMIITLLDNVAPRAGRELLDRAERMLVEQAPGLSADQLAKLVARAEAWLDPDGIEPREDEQRAASVIHLHQDRRGMFVLSGALSPELGAPVMVALDGMVQAALRAQREHERVDGSDPGRPSIPHLRAIAFSRLAQHAIGCKEKDLPLEGATVIVRIDHADLVAGTGSATIDGVDAPVSVRTARRMAAGGGVISCVLGADGDILDWGRERRLFTRPQKLALVERDGGCAMCGAPPSHTKVHHIRWWARDAGPTDLSNGVLLCESCHHRIHDNGWDIRVEGLGTRARVWFIPPAHVDPARTPRLGGRARYDLVA
jgi:5-methylcytosine-specific restriction protein A